MTILLADAAGKRMRPLQRAVGGVALARIEGAFLAIDGDEDDEVVELIAVEVILLEEVTVAVHDGHSLGVKARGAGEREKEHGEVFWRAALEREDIRCWT